MSPGASGSKVSTYAIQEALTLAAGGPILDLACGNGRHLPALIEANPLVFGGDISFPMLQVANSLLGDSPDITRLVRLDAERLPFPDDAFEVVISTRFFHHLPTRSLRATILSEAFRVSRKAVIITYKACLSWEHLLRRVKSLLRGNRGHLEHYYVKAHEIQGIAHLHGWRITDRFISQPFLGANRVLVMEPLPAKKPIAVHTSTQKVPSLPPFKPVIG